MSFKGLRYGVRTFFGSRLIRWPFTLCVFVAAIYGGYQWLFHEKDIDIPLGAQEVEASIKTIKDALFVSGVAELAHEQKMQFEKAGKVTQIFVKPMDLVKKDQVLATIDKREFYSEMQQVKTKLDASIKDYNERKEKTMGTDYRRTKREIEGSQRKLEESKKELAGLIDTAPAKTQDKVIDIEAKKRDIDNSKKTYTFEKQKYEKDLANKDTFVANKISQGAKIIETVLMEGETELNALESISEHFTHLFNFDTSVRLSSEELEYAGYAKNMAPDILNGLEIDWTGLQGEIQKFRESVATINTRTGTDGDAKNLLDQMQKIYTHILDMTNKAQRVADMVNTGIKGGSRYLDQREKNNTDIAALRSSAAAKVASLDESRDTVLNANDPKKITEQFLLDLQKRDAELKSQAEAIKKAELALRESIHDLGADNVQNTGQNYIDSATQNEILEKQSALLDEEDTIKDRLKDLEKMRLGKTSEIEGMEDQIKNNKEELEKYKTKEETYEIRAPFDGMVRTVKMALGDVVNMGGGSGGGGSRSDDSGEKYIILENADTINIKVDLSQNDIAKVSVGETAKIVFDSLGGAEVEGTIMEVGGKNSGNDDMYGGDFVSYGGGRGSTYTALLSAKKGELAIYSGMSVSVEITLGEKIDVLTVPVTAINRNEDTGVSYVNVIEGSDKIRKQKVELGLANKKDVEIISGLQVGDRVQIIDFNANKYKAQDFGGGGRGMGW